MSASTFSTFAKTSIAVFAAVAAMAHANAASAVEVGEVSAAEGRYFAARASAVDSATVRSEARQAAAEQVKSGYVAEAGASIASHADATPSTSRAAVKADTLRAIQQKARAPQADESLLA